MECERNPYADPKVSEGGGGTLKEGMLLQPMVRRQAVPLEPVEVHSGADLHLQPGEDPTPEQGDARRRLGPVGSPRWSRLLAGPVAPWRERSPRWSRFSGRTCDPTGDPRWSSLCLKDCSLGEGPHAGAGEECDESCP